MTRALGALWVWFALGLALGGEFLRLAWPLELASPWPWTLVVATTFWGMPLDLAAIVASRIAATNEMPVFRVSPTTLPYVVAAAIHGLVCAWWSRDLTAPEHTMVWALPFISGVGVLVALTILTHLRWLEARLGALTWAWVVAAPAVAFVLNGWLPDLNSLVKWWAILWVTAVVAAWNAHAGSAVFSRSKGAYVVRVALLLAVAMPLTGSIPQALAGAPARSAVGWAALVPWFLNDRDADGFYDVDPRGLGYGGADCDDADGQKHPASMRRPCSDAAPFVAADRTKGRNTDHVFVFIVDAMRGDVLAKHPGKFPNIESLARTGVNFTRAYSPGNATLMSLPSMLTGVTPVAMQDAMMRPDLKIQHYQSGRWLFDLDAHDCDAMIVQAHDYADWLFKAYPAPEVTLFFTDETPTGHGAPLAVRRFKDALEKCGDRRKTFVVYIDDPHIESDMTYRCADGSKGGYECYIEEIAVVDAAIGEMVAALRARPKMDRTTIVVTSDHGEAFGEHGHVAHASSVFEEQVHVPLIVHQPWRPARTVTTPVTTLGLAATVADETFARRPTGMYPSVLSAAEAGAYPPPVVYNWVGLAKLAWTAPSAALVIGDTKVQFDFVSGRGLQSDLGADPGERTFEAATPEQIQMLMRIHGTLMDEAQVREARQ